MYPFVCAAVAPIASAGASERAEIGLPDMQWSGVLTGIFIGMILLPIIYNAAFFPVLRERFLLWHGARGFCTVMLTIMLAPLAISPLLPIDSFPRLLMFFLFFDLAISISGPFLRSYLEPGMLSPKIYKLLGWSMPFTLAFTPLAYWVISNPTFVALRAIPLISVLIILNIALVQAFRRGSRAVKFQILAWAGVIVVSSASLIYNILFQAPLPGFFMLLFAAVIVEVIVSSVGVAYRFMHLKRQRDIARSEKIAMAKAALTDPLTKLPNRRALTSRFNDPAKEPIVGLAALDLDNFKKINDREGHERGDQVLVSVSAALQRDEFRDHSFSARLGGEEFVILFTHHSFEEMAEDMRQSINKTARALVPGLIQNVTASMGIIELRPEESLKSALIRADKLLYQAKANGRNKSLYDLAGRPSSKAAA